MSLIPGQPVRASVDNNAFISRITDSDTVGKVGLKNTELESGAAIDNAQGYINKIADVVGGLTETSTGHNDYANENYIADGDSRKVAIEKLDAQLKLTQDQLDAVDAANSLDVTLGAFETASSPEGLTLAGQQISLNPADETNPGALTAGTQRIGGDKTFAGNVLIEGDLEVQGTRTFVNTQDLDVLDANVKVNKNGTNLTAEGAGLEVERPLGNAALQFDSALASFWKIGLLADLKEIIVSGVAQVIAGVKDFTSGLKTDSVNESTLDAGVTVDGVLIKDGLVDGRDVSSDGSVLDSHVANTSNPHSTTAAQVGLGNVTNDAQLKRAAGDFDTFAEKLSVANDDLILIEDSADSFSKKKVKRSNFGGSGGGASREHVFKLNGNYGSIAVPFNYADNLYRFNAACTITDVILIRSVAGSSGSTQIDIKVKPPASAFASIFSTLPSIASAAGADAAVSVGEVVANTVAPVLLTTPFSVAANSLLRMDLIAKEAGNPEDVSVIVIFTPQ